MVGIIELFVSPMWSVVKRTNGDGAGWGGGQ